MNNPDRAGSGVTSVAVCGAGAGQPAGAMSMSVVVVGDMRARLPTLAESSMSKSSTLPMPVSSSTRSTSSSGSDTAHAEPDRMRPVESRQSGVMSTLACWGSAPSSSPSAADPRLMPGRAAKASGLSARGVGATTGPNVPWAQADAAGTLPGASCAGCALHPASLELTPTLCCDCATGACPKPDVPNGTAVPPPKDHGLADVAAARPAPVSSWERGTKAGAAKAAGANGVPAARWGT